MPEERRYKDYKIYCCFVLNRLVSELGIDLYQDGLEGKLDALLAARPHGISKEEVKHEIRSNHYMTEKVLEALQADGLVTVERTENRYVVRITPKGILHIRRFNEFYKEVYRAQIAEHYRFRRPPVWMEQRP
jgi:predicted transcriptional regulator